MFPTPISWGRRAGWSWGNPPAQAKAVCMHLGLPGLGHLHNDGACWVGRASQGHFGWTGTWTGGPWSLLLLSSPPTALRKEVTQPQRREAPPT